MGKRCQRFVSGLVEVGTLKTTYSMGDNVAMGSCYVDVPKNQHEDFIEKIINSIIMRLDSEEEFHPLIALVVDDCTKKDFWKAVKESEVFNEVKKYVTWDIKAHEISGVVTLGDLRKIKQKYIKL